MTQEKDTVGISFNSHGAKQDRGLTKVEYFAAMAMQGIISQGTTGTLNPNYIATLAVAQAHALINALNGK